MKTDAKKKKRKAKSSDQLVSEEPCKKRATAAPKSKTPKTRAETTDDHEDGEDETLLYPESPSQRRKMKAAAEACCTTNALTQSKLEDLKHVIRTPRQYPQTSTRHKLKEKKQLGISHFASKQEVEEKKPKEEASKKKTQDKHGGLHAFTFKLCPLNCSKLHNRDKYRLDKYINIYIYLYIYIYIVSPLDLISRHVR